MNAVTETKKLNAKITTEVIRRYYVEIDGWVYGGPFETLEESKACLKKAKRDKAFWGEKTRACSQNKDLTSH